MSKQVEVSIIVPVYNFAHYLNTCINSILNQTFTSFEIILVNDSSKDSAVISLIHQIKSDHSSKVLLFNQPYNQGQGAARNFGITKASGKYIVFMDGDDYFKSKESLDYMVTKIKAREVSIVAFGYSKLYDGIYAGLNKFKAKLANKKLFKKFKKLNLISPVVLQPAKLQILSTNGIGMSWAKIYLTEFIVKNNITFSESSKFEDVIFWIKSIIYSKGLCFCPESVLIYRKHTASTMNSQYSSNYQIIKTYQEIINTIKTMNFLSAEDKTIYLNALLSKALPAMISKFKQTPFKYKKLFFQELQIFLSTMNVNYAPKNLLTYEQLKTKSLVFFCIKVYFLNKQ